MFLSCSGEIDNVRQAVQSLQEDMKSKQKDLDYIASQQGQIIESISNLRESLGDVDGATSSDLSETLDGSGSKFPLPSHMRRRTATMHPLSESVEEES